MYTKGHWDKDWRQAQRRLTLDRLAKNQYPQKMDTTQHLEKEHREKVLAFGDSTKQKLPGMRLP